MARIFTVQPDGKYALYSTVSGGFILINATREELIKELVEEKEREITELVDASIEVTKTGKINFQAFTVKSYEDLKREHESRHGKI